MRIHADLAPDPDPDPEHGLRDYKKILSFELITVIIRFTVHYTILYKYVFGNFVLLDSYKIRKLAEKARANLQFAANALYRKFEKIFPEVKLCGFLPNFYIHVSVSDLYIPTIGPQPQYSKKGGPIVGMYKLLTDMNAYNFISGNIWFKFSVQCWHC